MNTGGEQGKFLLVSMAKTMEINPACLSGLPEFDLGWGFFDSAESVSVFV